MLDCLIENAHQAPDIRKPLCQDCGVAVIFVDIGQDVHVTGGDLKTAIVEGVRNGYGEGFLRKSMVACPFTERKNTGDNTPPVIHYRIVPGDRLKISLMAKGSGAENMSRLFMLKPAEGRGGVIEAAVRTVEEAGGKPCPPVIVGIGIGGTAEASMILAKRSLSQKSRQIQPGRRYSIPRERNSNEAEPAWYRAVGIGRHRNGPGRPHRKYALPHRQPAGGSQSPVP